MNTCWLEINRADGSVERRDVRPAGPVGIAAGSCPGCCTKPFEVRGGGPQRLPDDRTIRSGGRCVACGEAVGYLFAQPDTLFGLEEDERVLHGRPRVYW
ncbi:MAG TPA: hypothetical protein VFZ21_21125 [Gemmatimonadaceae bacterium]|nr:hypothetical protein [Gemmatimonadaceae bacterium]